MDKILELLDRYEDIKYEIDGNYINILNSSVMARIYIKHYTMSGMDFIALYVQEFDEFGNQTFNKEYANIGKSIINRLMKNVG